MQNLSSTNTQSWLIWFLKGLLILGAMILLARMVELQIIKGNYFHALAEGNRIRKVSVAAPRGLILARGGEILVDNKTVNKQIQFSQELGLTKVKTDNLSESSIAETIRSYPLGSDFAHASGYLGTVSQDEIGKVNPQCVEKGALESGDLVGRGGLEEQYSCLLRGVDGEQLIEVDTTGEKVRTLGTKLPVSGENLITTIDYEFQKKVAEVLRNKNEKSAAIATDGNGQVLAFYSHPSFDPNAFLLQSDEDNKKVSEYLKDSNLPLFNRVIGGAYHPGSVFKIVTAAAALEDNKIDPNWTYNDTGVITVNEFSYSTWYFTQYGRTEGAIDLKRAIARSTDTFFYKLGEFVGIDSLAEWSKKFGVGQPTGIDLPGEMSGLLPTPEWKKRVKNENWFLGNTYHMAIGQGDLETTVLESNLITSVIASDGNLCKPHLNTEIENQCTKLPISNQTIEVIRQGMVEACQTGGTAFPFFDFPEKVACKTGTAETNEEDKTHAWFTVMYPAENPEVVVTIIVEKGGEGSSVAAPLAREMLDFWHLRKNP